jgi:hypothetical protein
LHDGADLPANQAVVWQVFNVTVELHCKSLRQERALKNKADEMRREYRRENLGKGVRGKYFKQFQESSNVVVLDDDVAQAFPNSRAVNEALRGLLHSARRTDA